MIPFLLVFICDIFFQISVGSKIDILEGYTYNLAIQACLSILLQTQLRQLAARLARVHIIDRPHKVTKLLCNNEDTV